MKPNLPIKYNSSMIFVVIFTALFFIFLSGCIRTASPPDFVKIESKYMTPEGTFPNPSNCMSFICENRTGLGAFFLNVFGKKPSLYKGKCYLQEFDPSKKESMDDLKTILTNPKQNKHIMPFMIGQGPNIVAADEAQRFCEGNLGFAVHWMIGSSSIDPPIPSASYAECSLYNEIIPFYVYYTGAKNLPSSIYGGGEVPIVKISKAISGQGPVIIAPEAEFEVSLHPDKQSDYMQQFTLIKQNCKDCLISVFVKYNDKDTLAFLNRSSYAGYNSILNDTVSIVAFSIDLNQFKCDKYKIAEAAAEFSRYVLENYSKPTILVLKSSVSADCTTEKIAKVYENLYSNIPLFVPNGILGMANNEFSEMFDKQGNQYQPIFNSWFQNCKFYYDQSDVLNAPLVPLLFPKSGDTLTSQCMQLNTGSMLLAFSCDQNYSSISDVQPFDQSSKCGDTCFSDVFEAAGKMGITITIESTRTLDGYEKYCEMWDSEVRQFSHQFDFDPSLARSVLWFTTDFDPVKEPFKDTAGSTECTPCLSYSGNNKDICCGIERLAYYKDYSTNSIPPSYTYPYNSRDYLLYYFFIYGYRHGFDGLKDHINSYNAIVVEWLKNTSNPFVFGFEKASQDIVASAHTLRTTCGTCTSRSELGGSPWSASLTAKLETPLLAPNCIKSFGSDMGVYWLSGITLNSTVGDSNIVASFPGVVKEIGRGSRIGKYVVVSGGGLIITYSNLIEVNSSLAVGAALQTEDSIGKIDDYLRLEVCQGNEDTCRNSAAGTNRPFVNPVSALDIFCPS